jgi:radical SAM protein with 4Fe4S-binding SPASM domain
MSIKIRRVFPRRVAIENTTACNARCVFCPREKLTRKIETMDLETFRRLLDDAVEAGATRISLHNFGEPLLDKALPDKVAYAKSRGVEETFFVTNAALLTRELAEELIRAGLDRIKISFNGASREQYEALHVGLDFDTVVRNIRDLFHVKKRLGRGRPRIILRHVGTPLSYLRFLKLWAGALGQCSLLPGRFHNYTTGRNYNPVSKARAPEFLRSCRYLKRSVVYVLVNGDVVPCCYDFNGMLVMGNALEENLAEIWNGEQFQAFRRAHRDHQFEKYPVCAACDKLNYLFI